jgi:hypothetical protein
MKNRSCYRRRRVKEVKKVNMVDVLYIQNECRRLFKPVEITIGMRLRYKGER